MSLPSNNQVRQLFVAITEKAYDATVTNLGDTKVSAKTGPEGSFRITQIGHGGLVSSDIVDPRKVLYAKLTKADQMKEKLGVHKVTVTEVSAGQIYEIKLQINQYIGNGTQDMTYRIGTYKAKSSDTAPQIAAGLAASLQSALGYDKSLGAVTDIKTYREALCTVEVAGAVITIKEVEQEWSLGRFQVAHMPVRVFLGAIFTDDEYETYEWATIENTTEDAPLVTVSQKIADLEYFCHGARGDEYHGMGYPRNIVTKYMVDAAETAGYDLLDIHFYYQGSNESVQKSEKDLTVVLPAGDSHQIVDDINSILEPFGLEVEETE